MELIYFLANHPCEDPEVLKIIYYIRSIISVAFIVIPIVLIVYITFDFVKNVSAGNEDTMKKNQKIVIKRIVYCLMVFMVMPITNIAFSTFKTSGNEGLLSANGVNYLSCWANADNIASITALTIDANFNTDGGELYGGSSTSCGGKESCEIILPTATKTGYIFKGWKKSGSNDTYQAGEKITINKNDELTAIWDKKPKEEEVITDENALGNDKENKVEENTTQNENNQNNKEEDDAQSENNQSNEEEKENNNEENDTTSTSGVKTVKSGNYTYPIYDTQYTSKYRNYTYGTSTMYEAGCGVFSSAMLLAGLTNDLSVTPESHLENIKNYFPSYSSYYQSGVGSVYPGIWTSEFLESVYNVKSTYYPSYDYDDAFEHLKKGYPAIGSISGHMLALLPPVNNDSDTAVYVLDSIGKSTGEYSSLEDYREKWGTSLHFDFLLEPVN